MLTKFLGLPMVLVGALVLVLHFLLRTRLSGVGGNVLLCVGIVLELAGVVGYCWRVRHPQK